MIPGIDTGGGGFSARTSDQASAQQDQSFTASIGGNRGISFGATSSHWLFGLAVAGLTLAALYAYAHARRRKE